MLDIQERAVARGLTVGGKTKGRPDLAVFFPELPVPWRFIEIKRGADKLRPDQISWLQLLAEASGKASAIELTLKKP